MESLAAPTTDLLTLDSQTPKLRKPQEIVNEARERANVLMQIVKEQHLSKRLGNKDHIQIEAWLTVADFYNCSAGSDEAEPVEIEGVKGAKAHAKVTDRRTGLIVSEAISFCMRDEPNWKGKPWFQIASMAQTRAMSKALANKFRSVAVLAGYSGTPAEEMIHEEGALRTVEQAKHTARTKMAELASEPIRQEDGGGDAFKAAPMEPRATHQQTTDAPASSTALTVAEALDQMTLAQNEHEIIASANRGMSLAKSQKDRKDIMAAKDAAYKRIGKA
jgi:hypothetical protein